MRALRGNTPGAAILRMASWNTAGLSAACLGRRQGRTVKLTAGQLEASRRKLKWLRDWLDGRGQRPLIVVLLEVRGTFQELCRLRKWSRQFHYDARFLPGAGQDHTGGIVVLVATEKAAFTSSTALAMRALGISYRLKGDKNVRHVCGMHGLHGARGEHDFDTQMDAVEAWLEEVSGVVIGDFNRVVCSRWRRAEHVLTVDDRRVRAFAGWDCVCCGGEGEHRGRLIGGDGAACGDVGWTRFDLGVASSRIDYGIAVGAGEEGCWEQESLEVPEWVGATGVCSPMSDHALLVVSRAWPCGGEQAQREQRPKNVNLKRGDVGRKARAAFVDRVGDGSGWASRKRSELLGKEAGAAALGRGGGNSLLEGVAAELVSQGRRCEAEAREAAEKEKASKARESAHGLYQSWRRRLDLAITLRRAEEDVFQCRSLTLFHPKTGLDRLRRGREVRGSGRVWDDVVRVARRQVVRAGRAALRSMLLQDVWLVREGRQLLNAHVEPAQGFALMWRLLRKPRSSVGMDRARVGDAADGEQVIAEEEPERFSRLMAEIGELVVRSLDGGAVPAALAAWGEFFQERFEPLQGLDGGAWRLAEALTFEVFLDTLRNMPADKAVGKGGFSLLLLELAGREAQLLFYDALMRDIRTGRHPANWRHVLYVLLVKPAPNNPELVQQRREIALMPQDFKLFTQMVRRVAYARLTGRLHPAQMGGKPGYGAADVGLSLEVVLQQSVRLQRPVWVLYIDLATWYPSINRTCCTLAGMLVGLPLEVRQLVTLVYGRHGRPEEAVRCQMDSSIGLTEEYSNSMGRLMGCTLSPDEAQLILNTIVVAIATVVRGFSLWNSECVDGVWRQVLQMLYVDDWAATFSELKELRKAWAMWRVWERITGSHIGVKKALKTVITGSRIVKGRLESALDPVLKTGRGKRVAFIKWDEVYKHVGNLRRADGKTRDAVERTIKLLRPAYARIRRLQRPKPSHLVVAAEALMGSLVGFYCQTVYLTWQEAERMESRYRTIANRKLKRDRGSPRVQLYLGERAVRRTHMWAHATAALASTMCKAMADVGDTEQRAAARSSLGLALDRAGCRVSPGDWDLGHVVHRMEEKLRGSAVRDLGDALLLVLGLVECVAAESKDEAVRLRRVKEAYGRFKGLERLPCGDPLHIGRFTKPDSQMIFEPQSAGGLGIAWEWPLTEAGVVAVGHMCMSSVTVGVTGGSWRWMSHADAVLRVPRLRGGKVEERAWGRAIAALEAAGVQPVAPEWAGGGGNSLEDCMRRTAGRPSEVEVSVEQLDECVRMVESGSGGGMRSRHWREQFERCFPGMQPKAAAEWEHGGFDPATWAKGARIVAVLDAEGGWQAFGGEAGFLCRREGFCVRGESFGVGQDGWAEGWRERTEADLQTAHFDEQGWAVEPGVGYEMDEIECEQLPMALRFICRARRELGHETPVVSKYAGKQSRRTINIEVLRHNARELTEWVAKVNADVILATDGTWGWSEQLECSVAARAVVRHDGYVFSGRLQEPEGDDNYVAELAALVDAFAALRQGSRVVVVVDATSPVGALLTFIKAHARTKQKYNCDDLLDTLSQYVWRMEAVVFIWQTSHVGSPPNEWVDGEADKAREGDVVRVPRLPASHYSLALAAPRRSILEHVKRGMSTVVELRLRESLVHTQVREEADLICELSEEDAILASKVLAQRAAFGDARRRGGGMWAAVAGQWGCPAGCTVQGKRVRCTTTHIALFCRHAGVTRARGAYFQALEALGGVLAGTRALAESSGMAQQVELSSWVRRGIAGKTMPRASDGAIALREGDLPRDLSGARRVDIIRGLGGLFGGSGTDDDKKHEVRKAVREAVQAGLQVQRVGAEMTASYERQLADEVRDARKVRKWAKRWREAVLRGGPARAAALREVARAAARVGQALDDSAASGRLGGRERRWAFWRLKRSTNTLWMAARRSHRHEPMGQAAAKWCISWALRSWLARRRGPAGDDEGIVVSILGAVRVQLEVAGDEEVRRGIGQRRMAAARAWCAAGGVKGVKRAGAAMRERARVRRAALQEAALRRGLATEVVDFEPQVVVDLSRRARRNAAARRKRALRRREMERELRRGREADDLGRWAVREVLEVRRVGRRIEVKVAWEGVKPSEESEGEDEEEEGEPWEDSWVRMSQLTADLKRDVRRRLGVADRRRGGRGQAARGAVGWRRSPRLIDAGAGGKVGGRRRGPMRKCDYVRKQAAKRGRD